MLVSAREIIRETEKQRGRRVASWRRASPVLGLRCRRRPQDCVPPISQLADKREPNCLTIIIELQGQRARKQRRRRRAGIILIEATAALPVASSKRMGSDLLDAAAAEPQPLTQIDASLSTNVDEHMRAASPRSLIHKLKSHEGSDRHDSVGTPCLLRGPHRKLACAQPVIY